MIKSNRGQLSIFLGISLVIVMSMLAFIINVGLFVKAKINLQNAADAAAFSGAATQARQLTNIAYANWEMRNTYKEWMFKYYVLGQLGLLPYNLSNEKLNSSAPVKFLLKKPAVADLASNEFDKYNLPSICIHNNADTNICPIYALPGIPRFPSVAVAGISEIHDAFVNSLVKEKGKDCSRRSAANFITALSWAYGSGKDDIPDAPLVATNRPGAWPESLELAFRIRNLEMIVNRPAVEEITRQNVGSLPGQEAANIGYNERPIKAFWSAYRNLSGGKYKDAGMDELSLNLKLTEIAPQTYDSKAGGRDTVSSFLIPDNSVYPSGSGSPLQKQYLDLQLMPVNLATMYSVFVDMPNNNPASTTLSEAACGVSKAAMPVPGYIMGYTKNPEVITYYAVKAESKFIGLFFPINGSSSEGIKLTAYSAAKPFGGRIGPKLFAFTDNNQTVVARDDINRRSSAFITGLTLASDTFKPGMPIPSKPSFWVSPSNERIGGVPGTNATITYALPNMIYDFQSAGDITNQQSSDGNVQSVPELLIENGITMQKLGLYDPSQMRSLKESLGDVRAGARLSGTDVLNAIIRSRRATRYDVMNYLVPDFRSLSGDKNNAAPFIQKIDIRSNAGFEYKLFAPLVGKNLLHVTPNAIGSVIQTYMRSNDQAIDVYLKSLLDVANSIYSRPSPNGADYKEAAKTIHINAGTGNARPNPLPNAPATDPRCAAQADMASKFNHFFRESNPGCGVTPLELMMISYIANHSQNDNGIDRSLYYTGLYYDEPSRVPNIGLKPEEIMTAYSPGARQGAIPGDSATVEHPLKISTSGNESYSAKRNYYSTKFFQMAKIMDSPPMTNNSTRGSVEYQETPALVESGSGIPADLNGKVQIKNPLHYDAASGINNNYFLDF